MTYQFEINGDTVLEITESMESVMCIANEECGGCYIGLPLRPEIHYLIEAGVLGWNGFLTPMGEAIQKAIDAHIAHTIDIDWAEYEAEEMDELDRQLRRRPNKRQPVEEFNYGN